MAPPNRSLSPVFLSASAPDPRRDARYYNSAKPLLIREAITLLVRTIVPRTTLVFGGHPAVSPLVLRVATQLKAQQNVVIYLSEFYRRMVSRDSLAFPVICWTPAGRDDEESQRIMRNEMLNSRQFDAAFFVGGMEGVELEWELFEGAHASAERYPIASTGAAASSLLRRRQTPRAESFRARLEADVVYTNLFEQLLGVTP